MPIIHGYEIPEIQKIGVYSIRNTKNDKRYIGSSTNVYSRMMTRANDLATMGMNRRISADIIKYGYKCFVFEICETFEDNTITDAELRERENYYMNMYRTMDNGYNLRPAFSNPAVLHQKGLLVCKKIKPRNDTQTNIYRRSVTITLDSDDYYILNESGMSVDDCIEVIMTEANKRIKLFDIFKKREREKKTG